MSTAAPPQPPPLKRKQSQKDKDTDREQRERERSAQPAVPVERLKTVVRRLPPNLPEDIFWQSVQEWVSDATTTWRVYYPGKLRKKLNKENIPSRAYIAFANEDQLALFSRSYDGHLFRDKAGNESQAVVEYAPYQKIPTEKRKPDPRNGTIEKDDDYISFLATLAAAAEAQPVSLETLIAASQAPAQPKTTPLLEALKAEKSAHKDKEAILRNHAHYKEQSKKDDGKKKGAAAAAKPEPPPGPSSKRAAKKAAAAAAAAAAKQPAPPQKPVAGPSTAGPSKAAGTPKAPRAMRQQQQQQETKATAVVPGPPSPPGDSGPNTITANAPRRARPVVGLASRQFEAALSGAGVASGRPRRERDQERASPAAAGPLGASEDSSARAQSPRKERGGRRGGDSAAGATGAEYAPQVKVLNILQRGAIPAAVVKPAESGGGGNGEGSGPSPVESGPGVIGDGARGRGGRRGRGRGRGGGPVPGRGLGS